ncbi:uncharacterized protein CCR75_000649 [Bremia lactucae]|uniref:Uncharacterized protein n=1 Tax=Bremia lactucae TaxID=4779 RepID=A0A976FDH1_BRELC|nr:hypothetical protein CCR75_000649 [Bremia lactucae]
MCGGAGIITHRVYGILHDDFQSAILFPFLSSRILLYGHLQPSVRDVVMSIFSLVEYFNQEGVLGELEEVAADSVLALRNAVQYVRLALFLKNRSDRPTTIGKDIDFEKLSVTMEGEREVMLNAENGTLFDSDNEEEIEIV